MKYEYHKNRNVSYSECDKKAKMGLVNVYNLAEDLSTEYFGTFKSDNVYLRKYNAAWVYTKIYVHINNAPNWNESISCKTYTAAHTRIKTIVESVVKNSQGENSIIIKHEACPIDLETRKIRKLETISYPEDMENEESLITTPFSRLTQKFDKEDFVYMQKVQACDIDFTNHTNNVMYVKYLLNSFNSDFWNDKEITDFEIQFLRESREGELLKIYRKEIEKNTFEFLILRDETELIKAKLCYKNL